MLIIAILFVITNQLRSYNLTLKFPQPLNLLLGCCSLLIPQSSLLHNCRDLLYEVLYLFWRVERVQKLLSNIQRLKT